MTNWHNDNPIMTTESPVTVEELIAAFTLNGTADVCRFDVRIDSEGRMYNRFVPGKTWRDIRSSRDGVVIYSDEPMPGAGHEVAKGHPSEWYRNFFGVIVRREAR